MIAERATVVGAGSWGTAFSLVLADAGLDVRLWARRPELATRITETRRNGDYLPEIDLPDEVHATADVDEALEEADLVVLAIPAQKLRAGLAEWAPRLPERATLVSLAKGIELGTGCRMSEVILQATGVAPERLAVVSGPNLAREIAERQPAAGVVAAFDPDTADLVAAACASPWFRPYTSTDVTGCEIAGATKNVIALAVGAAEGLGLGDNSKASVITRGLAETVRLGVALGADPATFSGLAGVGDLIATCMSPLSRNHRVGVGLGRGGTVESVVASIGQTAEGVTSCESILALAREAGVEVPIVESVVAMVADGQRPELIVDALMRRQRKPEKA
ncbi:NAD(P)H-dependent glycerol-3-phosphate dehydrogenase [Mobilicoccus pelagius]|uniref:Glycerol-3-phosphate dehydrogenase [NAD(P)+] n=1 Tax=Mobilicoccus pelagius NBRC 104925 TaxID=1089455 RepID=H5UNG1_9MICO|nr:NAD(P)H-dependent glycerol-3-phosphate dehydrogenase [Mobilicoccus pelagius]GAB47269.1 NAD(P)H-dependent glycerol-3-phosphate dehydrogenase [Mobilicoccus pelagius NBRC 104925]